MQESEILSLTLKQLNVPHQILNARSKPLNESKVVCQAGEVGSITVSTNMAGRGTDILLGGDLLFKILIKLVKIFSSNYLLSYKKKFFDPYFLLYKYLLKNVSQRFVCYLLLYITVVIYVAHIIVLKKVWPTVGLPRQKFSRDL